PAPPARPPPAPPRALNPPRHTAVAARQDALQQAALDIVLLDLNRADLAALAHVVSGPAQVLARLHAVPLIRRVRLGHKVRHRRRHLAIAPGHLATDAGDLLRHVDDPVEIDLALAGQAAHEIELDALPAILERFAAANVEILILDLLADLFAHVVAGHFRRQRQAALACPRHQLRHAAELVVDTQAWQRHVDPERSEHLVHTMNQLLEVRVIAGAQAQQANFVVAGILVALQRRLDDRLDRADAQWSLDDSRLAETTLPGTATHDLDGNAVVWCLHERDDRPRRERNVVEVLGNRASHDF